MKKKWISLQQVDVYLDDPEVPVLLGLNLELGASEWVAVVGRNGSGKSVLGRLLAGLEGRYVGTIHRSSEAESGQVRWVMQNPDAQLIGETVWDDVVFGLENMGLPPVRIREEAERALELTGLFALAERPVQELSGGQKQLTALAGAIALRPSVLVADEVTSMLDPASRGRVLEVLQRLHREGTTVVMLTQYMEETVLADRLIALRQGKLVYDGEVRRFFYGDGGSAACYEQTGLLPPYAVRMAQALIEQGVPVEGAPLTVDELMKAVGSE